MERLVSIEKSTITLILDIEVIFFVLIFYSQNGQLIFER